MFSCLLALFTFCVALITFRVVLFTCGVVLFSLPVVLRRCLRGPADVSRAVMFSVFTCGLVCLRACELEYLRSWVRTCAQARAFVRSCVAGALVRERGHVE